MSTLDKQKIETELDGVRNDLGALRALEIEATGFISLGQKARVYRLRATLNTQRERLEKLLNEADDGKDTLG